MSEAKLENATPTERELFLMMLDLSRTLISTRSALLRAATPSQELQDEMEQGNKLVTEFIERAQRFVGND